MRKIACCACAGNAGNVSPPSRVSDPDMYHGTCVTHVPRYMPGSLTSGFLWSRWRGKRFRHSRRIRNPQFYASGKRRMLSIYPTEYTSPPAFGLYMSDKQTSHPPSPLFPIRFSLRHFKWVMRSMLQNTDQDDVIKWKHFPCYWPFVWGIHRSLMNPPTKTSDAELWCILSIVPE